MKPCTRCGAPSRHQWQSGAEWLPFCVRCDVELNAAAIRYVKSSGLPGWGAMIDNFIRSKRMPEPKGLAASLPREMPRDSPMPPYRYQKPEFGSGSACGSMVKKAAPSPGSDEWRAILCNGPTEDIPDDDPGLALFTEGTLEDRKVALAIERVNSCD